MKTLTVITTLFMPISFLSGFFGMNFEHLPGLRWEYGVAVTTIFMIVVAGGMLWAFRRKQWM